MQSRFVKTDAEAMVVRYGEAGVSRDLALRVYTTRLLGADPRLVLHGGGNTSVKTRTGDLMGREVEGLCVKSSGADMATIEPAGLPAGRPSGVRGVPGRARVPRYEYGCPHPRPLNPPHGAQPSRRTH